MNIPENIIDLIMTFAFSNYFFYRNDCISYYFCFSKLRLHTLCCTRNCVIFTAILNCVPVIISQEYTSVQQRQSIFGFDKILKYFFKRSLFRYFVFIHLFFRPQKVFKNILSICRTMLMVLMMALIQ